MREDVAKAITVVETSRKTHVDWLEWQAANPNWREQVAAEPTVVGDPAHHQACVADYDHVLAVLRSIEPQEQEPRPQATAHHTRPAGEEVPWHETPPDAHLVWLDDVTKWDAQDLDGLGYLHWYDPEGNRAAVPVTRGASTKLDALGHVWHIEDLGDQWEVSPSIHFIGYWHSPNPVRFVKVDSLPS